MMQANECFYSGDHEYLDMMDIITVSADSPVSSIVFIYKQMPDKHQDALFFYLKFAIFLYYGVV